MTVANALRGTALGVSIVTGTWAIGTILLMLIASVQSGWGVEESMAGMIIFMFNAVVSSLAHTLLFVTSRDWLKTRSTAERRFPLLVWGISLVGIILGIVAHELIGRK
jgi:hypothetical protein